MIVDRHRVRRWEAQALAQLCESAEFVVLNCTNTRFKRHPVRHALYYLLNILSLRTSITQSVPLPAGLKIVGSMDFESIQEGAWQRLPSRVLEALSKWRPALALKFGMGLLRLPEEIECKILSFHHGDPRQFRGRPGGFYELLGNVPTVGQIVQIITNRLDAGAVVAFGETPVQPYSYRGTMEESYRTSPLLMKSALANCLSGTELPLEPTGRNHRLPSNWAVARFAAKMIKEKAKRLVYGAFIEKAWQVVSAQVTLTNAQELLTRTKDRARWRIVPRPHPYGFLADPFPHPSDGVIVEALRRRDGQGEIVHFGSDSTHVYCSGPAHFSYPGTFRVGGHWYLIPEVSEWSPPRIYRIAGDECEFVGHLDVESTVRLVDPTLHAQDGTVYLFANEASEGSHVLRLWTAKALFSRFTEHPESPIRISPAGSRMAGAILRLGTGLYRLGQQCSRGYGKAVILFEITRISLSDYREEVVGELTFDGVSGPHTLNVRGDTVYFDFYTERFALGAGIRRMRALLSKIRGNLDSRTATGATPALLQKPKM